RHSFPMTVRKTKIFNVLPVSLLGLINNGYNVARLADPTIAPYQAPESLQFAASLRVFRAVGYFTSGRCFT
ncbi:hypothetical protein, partial [Escherichia coli]|uniref:hypothetical protein n=1 Tax=Escherichia coli TaxID=562 RepID=UPI003B9B21D1